MDAKIREKLIGWAEKYDDMRYFTEDPIIFPRKFALKMKEGDATLRDVEIAAVFAAHLAWGRRALIVRDCERLFEEMDWRPEAYVMAGDWRNDSESLHRTVKWSEAARICRRLREWYSWHDTLEGLEQKEFRTTIFGSKDDPRAPDKKINLLRRWMVRDDGKVDLGVWKHSDRNALVIPLDVHVHRWALELGLTARHQKDLTTALEITEQLRQVFPGDPCLGDFALFGYGVSGEDRQYRDA